MYSCASESGQTAALWFAARKKSETIFWCLSAAVSVFRCATPSTPPARAISGPRFRITPSSSIAGYLAFKGDAAQSWRLFLMTGILGGYTTFSAFSLDAGLLYELGKIGLALLYVVLSIAGLFAGLALVRHLA
jgi:hypothetical protein